MQGWPAGFPRGMPGMGDEIEGATQQAAQPGRQAWRSTGGEYSARSRAEGMPAEGLEPSSHRWQQILSLPCMPFHHAGDVSSIYYGLDRESSLGPWSVDLRLTDPRCATPFYVSFLKNLAIFPKMPSCLSTGAWRASRGAAFRGAAPF